MEEFQSDNFVKNNIKQDDINYNKYLHKKSLTNKNWNFFSQKTVNTTNAIDTLLNNRKIPYSDIKELIAPSISSYIDCLDNLQTMDIAADRVINAILNKEKITIMGDYDVDGVSSSALLIRFFKYFKIDVNAVLPSRFDHGYGLNIKKIEQFKDNLIIAVDCGAVAHDELSFAKSIGADVIVLDHHKMHDIPTGAVAIVNPSRPDEDLVLREKFSIMCAAGVCFLFTIAVIKKLRKINYFQNHDINEPSIRNYLDLVALATICDVVPLYGINRAIVKEGLKFLANNKNLGINLLLENVTNVTAETIAFTIGPKLNAAGRLDSAHLSLDLLTSEQYDVVDQISKKLLDLNVQRQEIEYKMLNEALEQFEQYNASYCYSSVHYCNVGDCGDEKTCVQDNKHSVSKFPTFILVHSNDWHVGVIGIVAGRLKETFYLPSFVIAFDENDIGTASCRSVDGVDLAHIVSKIRHLLVKGGGHKMAAGFTIHKSNLKELEKILSNEIKQKFFATINIDGFLNANEINETLVKEINKLEPFGQNNEKPRFVIKNVQIDAYKIIKEKHLQITFKDNSNNYIKTISFNSVNMRLGDFFLNEYTNEVVDILCSLGESIWNGKKYTSVFLHDVMV